MNAVSFPALTLPRIALPRGLFILLAILAPSLVLMLGLVAISAIADIPSGTLTRDPVATLGGACYVGCLSNLGILAWASATAVCFFSSSLLYGSPTARFLFTTGAFTLFLLLDDLFLFHEQVFPKTLHVPETLVLLAYIGVALLYGLACRRFLCQGSKLILAAACIFFATSLGLDAIGDDWLAGNHYWLEDGAKFLGIVTWTTFLLLYCGRVLKAGAGLQQTEMRNSMRLSPVKIKGRVLIIAASLLLLMGPEAIAVEHASVPSSLQKEHTRLRAQLIKATREPGRLGLAAKEVHRLLSPHFHKEEAVAMPPLVLLPELATGSITQEMRQVLPLTDRLERELPQMLAEHRAIVHAVRRFSAIARQEKRHSYEAFAEELVAHARTEEQILYPAAILVGKYINQGTKP